MILDPTAPRLKPALARGGVAAAWFALGDPAVVEIAGRAGPDVAVVDMQHGLFDRRLLEAAVTVSAAPVLVRTRDDHPASLGEALDAGAEGVIVPLVETAETAAAVARACRYPPDGVRSGGGIRPTADFPTYAAHANAAVVAGVMIETAAGVEAADAIARSGVDLVFIGTGDLALSLGTTPGSERHEAAVRAVLDACRRAGIPAGCFAMTAAAAAQRLADGFRMSVAAIDIEIVAAGARTAFETVRAAAPKRGRATRPRG
jgi:2-keto-3-deoxy-L-rhamnonate aldolase RhmA